RARPPLDPQEGPGQIERRAPGQNPTDTLRLGGGHHRRRQPQPAGLDEVFPAQPLDDVQTTRPVGTPKAAEHPAQTTQARRTSSWAGSSTLAQCLLRDTRPNLLSLSSLTSGQC